MLSAVFTAHAQEHSDFTYTIINGEATVTGFTGEPSFIEIPETLEGFPVTQIRDNAFFSCSSLKQISLPPTIREIGHHTFYACTALESIVLPDNLKEIGMGAFKGCTSLSAVNIPDTLTILPEACFSSCISLTETVIPDGVAVIDDFCFSGCSLLSYVSIGNTVSTIGQQAFYMCPSLESLYIPPSVKLIESYAAGFPDKARSNESTARFTVLGSDDSAAKAYAEENGFAFSASADSVQIKGNIIKKVPHWLVPALIGAGGVFFALSCFIAVKQFRSAKKHTDNSGAVVTPTDKNP